MLIQELLIFLDGKINYVWLTRKIINTIKTKDLLICTISLLMLKKLFMIKFVKNKRQ